MDTLVSVANQTHPHVEHIVIDGGSTDGTVELLERVAGDYGLTWVSEPDDGMYDAINRGLARASGTIIAYLNSDDLYLPWSVEAAVAALERGPDMVFGDLGVMWKDVSSHPTSFHVQFYEDWEVDFYTHSACPAQPTFFWTRGVFERIGGFSNDFRLIADCDYWLRASEAGFSIQHLREVLAIQTEHGGTLRNQHADALASEFRQLRRTHGQRPPNRRLRAWWQVRRRVFWRQRMVQFWLSGKGFGNGWGRFHRFVQEADRSVELGSILHCFLPQPLRPATWSVVDPLRLYDALVEPTR